MSPWQFISLLDMKARMALKSEASKLYLSYLWWVLEPILWVLMFYFVFEVLLGFGRNIFFLMCGKIPFLWFSKSVNSSSNAIVSGKGMVNQTNMPKQFFPYLACQEALYKQWLVFVVLFGVAMVYGSMPSLHWLWVLPLIFVQYLLIVACALIAALLVSYVRDMRILISMGTMFLMFSSGIFWDINDISDPVTRDMLMTWNPLAFLLDAYRHVIMHGTLYDMQHLLVVGLASLGIIGVMHVIYAWKSQDIASRVINS